MAERTSHSFLAEPKKSTSESYRKNQQKSPKSKSLSFFTVTMVFLSFFLLTSFVSPPASFPGQQPVIDPSDNEEERPLIETTFHPILVIQAFSMMAFFMTQRMDPHFGARSFGILQFFPGGGCSTIATPRRFRVLLLLFPHSKFLPGSSLSSSSWSSGSRVMLLVFSMFLLLLLLLLSMFLLLLVLFPRPKFLAGLCAWGGAAI